MKPSSLSSLIWLRRAKGSEVASTKGYVYIKQSARSIDEGSHAVAEALAQEPEHLIINIMLRGNQSP